MNLKEEINKNAIIIGKRVFCIHCGRYLRLPNNAIAELCTCGNADEQLKLGDVYITTKDAIEIAEKYAEEMCRKQIELCVEAFIKQRQLFLEFDFDIKLKETVFADTIENAPLATEE